MNSGKGVFWHYVLKGVLDHVLRPSFGIDSMALNNYIVDVILLTLVGMLLSPSGKILHNLSFLVEYINFTLGWNCIGLVLHNTQLNQLHNTVLMPLHNIGKMALYDSTFSSI